MTVHRAGETWIGAMQYPDTRYVRVGDDYLELYSWDGLRRGVVFRDPREADLAMIPGRAYLDVAVIEAGCLPKGATLVSGAAPGIDDTRLVGDPDNRDPLLLEEQKRAVVARAAASRHVTRELDAAARRRDADRVARYEAVVALIEREQAERATGRLDP